MQTIDLLDTSVWSQPIKDRPLEHVLERWSQVGDEQVCTSAICLAEVLQGLEDRASPGRALKRQFKASSNFLGPSSPCRHNKPVAELRPLSPPQGPRPIGLGPGRAARRNCHTMTVG